MLVQFIPIIDSLCWPFDIDGPRVRSRAARPDQRAGSTLAKGPVLARIAVST
jgi:hypothetical protein